MEEGLDHQGEERRRHPRFQCAGKAEMRSLVSGFRTQGKVENLSLSGCKVQLSGGQEHRFHRGEKVEMTFCVRQLSLRVQASIRQMRGGESEAIGVEFTLLTERGRRQLQELIDELNQLVNPVQLSQAAVS